MSREFLEETIQEKGLTTAPRITPTDIENCIVDEKYHVFEGTTFTACLLTLRNGYNVIGESACASPENFDAELGRSLARSSAVNKIWALEGYLLKEKLYREKKKNIFYIDLPDNISPQEAQMLVSNAMEELKSK